jgi:hypothetical protein
MPQENVNIEELNIFSCLLATNAGWHIEEESLLNVLDACTKNNNLKLR